MTLHKASLALILTLLSLHPHAGAQTPSAPAKPDPTVVKTFYLANITQANDGNELFTALRNVLPPSVISTYLPSQQTITVRGTPDQLELVQQVLHDLDRPRKTYRLSYTLTETDAGKRIGTQHVAVVVVSGGRTTVKQGSKIPVATGMSTPNSSGGGTQTQVSYIDIGLNIDASLDDGVDGVRLRTKIEQSGVATQTSGMGPGDPIVRQTLLEGTSILTPGKPVILGALDIPDTTRHLDVDVVLDPLR